MEPLGVLRGEESITALDYAPLAWAREDGRSRCIIVSGDSKGEICVWDLETRRKCQKIRHHLDQEKDHQLRLFGIVFLEFLKAERKHLVTQGREGVVCIWSWTNGGDSFIQEPCAGTIATGCESFCACSVVDDQDALWLASCTQDPKVVKVWAWLFSNAEARESSTFPEPTHITTGMCMALQLVRHGQLTLVALFESGHVLFGDAVSGVWLNSNHVETNLKVGLCMKLARSEGNQLRGLAGGSGNTIAAFTVQRDCVEKSKLVSEMTISKPGISCIAIRDDRKLFATGGWDSSVRVFAWKTMKPMAILRHHHGIVHAVRFSPLGNQLASGGEDGHIALWAMPNPKS